MWYFGILIFWGRFSSVVVVWGVERIIRNGYKIIIIKDIKIDIY